MDSKLEGIEAGAFEQDEVRIFVAKYSTSGVPILAVRTYQILAGSLAIPWRIVSNAAGRTAVLFHFGGSNTPISLDLGGTIVNGRFAVMTIDP